MDMNYQCVELSEIVKIPKIISVHYFPYTRNFIYTGERHNFWEFVYVDSGEVTVFDEDTQLILKSGQCFLHAPNHFHNIKANNKYSNTIIFAFDGYISFAHKLLDKIFDLSDFEKNLCNVILSEGRATFNEPLDILTLEKMSLKNNYPLGSLQIIKCSLESLLISLGRTKNKTEIVETKSEVVGKILQILQANICESVSIESIAKSINYSPTYTKTIFRTAMNTSIIQYFISLKIDVAKQKIADGDMSLSQISDYLGFDSLPHFSRTFKTHTNMSPSDYKKSVIIAGML